MLVVADTGHGISQDALDRIFEPFFSTKRPGEGTGLGLAMVFGIVKAHGGHVKCESELGSGTTFKIYLPVGRGIDMAPGQYETFTQMASGTETILLVDDEDAIRELGRRILTRAGIFRAAIQERHRGSGSVQQQEGRDISRYLGPHHARNGWQGSALRSC